MRRLWVLFAATIVSGCAAAFGQTDDFPDKLHAGCRTRIACERLVAEAEARVQGCAENTVGRIRCSDARADRVRAKALLKPFDEADERERQEQERDDQERRQREAREEREAAQEARKAREDEVRERIDRQKREQHAKVIDRLRLIGADDRMKRLRACQLERGRCDALLDDLLEAAESDDEKKALARANEEPPPAPPEPPPQASPAPPRGGGGGGGVTCCDGTTSGCTYVHRGCCSHHGGVCGG